MTIDERSQMIDQIIAAARRPVPDIVEKRELQGSDGKWYGAGGFPLGVNFNGETRAAGFVFRDRTGVTYGTRENDRQALIDRFNNGQDREMAGFRAELEAKSDDKLQESHVYWMSQHPR